MTDCQITTFRTNFIQGFKPVKELREHMVSRFSYKVWCSYKKNCFIAVWCLVRIDWLIMMIVYRYISVRNLIGSIHIQYQNNIYCSLLANVPEIGEWLPWLSCIFSYPFAFLMKVQIFSFLSPPPALLQDGLLWPLCMVPYTMSAGICSYPLLFREYKFITFWAHPRHYYYSLLECLSNWYVLQWTFGTMGLWREICEIEGYFTVFYI